jgi:hypothetical protein
VFAQQEKQSRKPLTGFGERGYVMQRDRSAFVLASLAKERRSVMSRLRLVHTLLLSALLMVAPISLAQPSPQQASFHDVSLYFKQLAGPPTEFGDMAPADPLAAARHSKSALLPVTMQSHGTGKWSWQSEIPVEGETWRFAVIPGSPDTAVDSWEVTVRGPIESSAQPPEVGYGQRRATQFGLSSKGIPAVHHEISGLAPGDYTLTIESDDPGEGFLLIEGAGPLRLLSHQAAFNQLAGQRIFLIATVYDRDLGADQYGVAKVSEALLRVRTPDGGVVARPMHDDGMHLDGEASDGVYGGSFLASRAGNFNAQVVFRGQSVAHGRFVRTAEHLIPVLEDDTHLVGDAATGSLRNDRRIGIRLDLSAPEDAGHYRVYAEVWGTDPVSHELSTPVAWVGGMAVLGSGDLELGLDTRWISLSRAQEPFELRNVRIEDPDYFITLTATERMPLALPTLPPTGVPADQIVVDEEMLAGPRPDFLDPAEPGGGGVDCAKDHRLLLVHGWCSSDVWSPETDHFDNAEVFLDLEQNRLHDEFAQLILGWALDNGWRSYGIVAHSQGGMAALHLYNYYWSGLDNAGTGRLIQSVGTPYQGTELMDLPDILIDWFTCGTNYDLSPSGAIQWLDGISTASREQVNYYSTSFEDAWWCLINPICPFCNPITSAILDGPFGADDGVVGYSKAQLPDGVNQGHKKGWCHTGAWYMNNLFNDPQTTDGSRNNEMNENAAAASEEPPCRGLSGPPKP